MESMESRESRESTAPGVHGSPQVGESMVSPGESTLAVRSPHPSRSSGESMESMESMGVHKERGV